MLARLEFLTTRQNVLLEFPSLIGEDVRRDLRQAVLQAQLIFTPYRSPVKIERISIELNHFEF